MEKIIIKKDEKDKKVKYKLKNVVVINGVEYVGEVEGDENFIATLKYIDEKIEWEKQHIKSEEVHPDKEIGRIKG
ncbi:MAG TPA: hypothetical protein PKV21_07380 [bacterium]|nr:hypothetical protein [bacterium]